MSGRSAVRWTFPYAQIVLGRLIFRETPNNLLRTLLWVGLKNLFSSKVTDDTYLEPIGAVPFVRIVFTPGEEMNLPSKSMKPKQIRNT